MPDQNVEGSIGPTGDVVDFVIEIDNPEGFITPFGGLHTPFIDSVVVPGADLVGQITPTGALQLIVPEHCFPTDYTCITSVTPEYVDCIGVCVDIPVPAIIVELAGSITPTGELVESCPEVIDCQPCPPWTVGNCNDVLRVLQEKVIAWHIVTCGVLLSGGNEVGEAYSEHFDGYADLNAMQANGWVFVQTYTNPLKASWGIDQSLFFDGTRSLRVIVQNNTGAGETKWYKDITLSPNTNYDFYGEVIMDHKAWYENTTMLNLSNQTSPNDPYTNNKPPVGMGVWKTLHVQGTTDGAGVIRLTIHGAGGISQGFTAHFDYIRAIGIVPGTAAVWEDQSGHERHLVWVSGNKPTLTGTLLQGHNTLIFNNAYMAWPVDMLADVSESSGFEAFLVIKTTSGSGLWRLGADAASPTLFFDTASGKILENFGSDTRLDYGTPIFDLTTDFRIYSIQGDATQVFAFINGALQAGPLAKTFAVPSAPEFGRSDASTPGNFEVAEVIVTTGLTDDERNATLEILTNRWGIT